jgi:hypothetical protein
MEQHGSSLFGLAAEFDSAEHVLEAAKRIRAEGYRRAEAYTPFDVHGLADCFGEERTGMPTIVMGGALIGAIGGFFMLWFANVISYHWNIGGRPPNSWPAFIPITFELGVLGAGLSATFGMFIMNRLPQPHHPIFNAPGFEAATRNRFFICIQANDPKFELQTTRTFLQSLGALTVNEVPR